MLPAFFDPAVSAWFKDTFSAPTPCQVEAWQALNAGRNTLIAAPTGSGKTLAAFLTAINDLFRQIRAGTLEDATRILYVSPLKALSNDVQRNLEAPLHGIESRMANAGETLPQIRTAVRTGDTPAAARALMRKHPPHILVTTPESLYILLTSESGRAMLSSIKTVIIDEIHALAPNKRGAHLALSLARLDRLTAEPATRVGLSATQRPISRVADYLTNGRSAECAVIDRGHVRRRELALEMPPSPLETVLSAEVAEEIRARMVELINAHRTTLIFVNTRRMAERLSRALGERLGDDQVCAHHGSMSRERRLSAESRLKNGELKALVATASLELGIDIGDVDLVCQLGATRTLATLLQRVGRSGHAISGIARGRLFPQTRDELVECIALLDMVAREELDSFDVPAGPLDVLAQQLVAEVACSDYAADDLYVLCRGTFPYRELARERFDSVLSMLAQGFAFARGRTAAYVHLDEVNGQVRARRGARLVATTCGGAIPDTADYDVIAEPNGEMVGTVNEDFAIESLPGNIFQLGNGTWRVLRVESSALRVVDATGQPPNMPFWLGEAPARSLEMSAAVSRLKTELAAVADRADATATDLAERLLTIAGVPPAAAAQAADYVLAGYRALGAMPTQDTLVMERFFDDSGGMQLVIHAPFGSRLNKAWGLALRKRFCRTFNFELQAAAIEDAIVISLGAVHSFALDEVWRYLNADTVRDVLTQALLDAPVFTVRWRWVAACALAIQRFRSGRKVPPRLIRMNAEDLVALVFPDQLACAENLSGRREVPDHPLVTQAIDDCLHEAMDVGALEALLRSIAAGQKRLVARDVTEPSPFAQAVLNANPYAFLDDAPLEERRTQAVSSRRWLDPATAQDLGALDPAAIERVQDEVWPQPRDAEELHEALTLLGFVTEAEFTQLCSGRADWEQQLFSDGRLVYLEGEIARACATERRAEVCACWPHARLRQSAGASAFVGRAVADADECLQSLLRSRLEMSGPLGKAALEALFGRSSSQIEAALCALEAQGIVLRGRFSPGATDTEWCDRRLLARIHRHTLERLRQAVKPATTSEFMRFLLDWQHVTPGHRLSGESGLELAIAQLGGFEAPAAAWEGWLLPQRVRPYQGEMLDTLAVRGRAAWLRLTPKKASPGRSAGTLKNTPLTIMPRNELRSWLDVVGGRFQEPGLSSAAQLAQECIRKQGALFFDDIVSATGLLRTQCENALDELAACGVLTCDSYQGLRLLTRPSSRPGYARRGRSANDGLDMAGRWSCLDRLDMGADEERWQDEETVRVIARTLLRRYGVVFRSLVCRETALPPWRYLLYCFRRMEARGEVRGGRFVASIGSEQFALPEAVEQLRQVRRREAEDEIVSLNATDPLNLIGTVLPGVRIPALENNQLVLVGGELGGYRLGNEYRVLMAEDNALALKIRTALVDQRGKSVSRSGLRNRRR